MNPDGNPISLFFQQIWCEIDLISGDYLNAELSQGILTVKEAEQLVGRLVVQLFSCVGIDVAHHKVNISLRQMVKGYSLWQYPANHLMCYLTAAFLI